MTLAQLYRQCRKHLTHDTADFDLSQLFHAQFGRSPGLSRPEAEAADDEAFVFRHKVRRLAEGYPLQYLLGEWEFFSLPLKVGEGVLIPRPDTETVVETAISLARETGAQRIADLCAGSGAIAIALATHLPGTRLLAVELSAGAMEYLRENIALNGMQERIEALEADALLPHERLTDLNMIVSNPPYLTAQELEELPTQVRWEPKLALDGGADGLRFYRAIAENAASQLMPGGAMVFEVGWRQAADVAAILSNNGFCDVRTARDLNGVERCVFGTLPKE